MDPNILLGIQPNLYLTEPDPSQYFLPEEDPLLHAVWSALTLGRPLLLTGEPGTGKTELAYWLAWLMAGSPLEGSPEDRRKLLLRFDTKSTSQARDLFYRYDVMKRFGDQQIDTTREDSKKVVNYLSLGPLGEAILRALTQERREEVAEILGPKLLDKAPFTEGRSVVLVDEIDKAPRDFPNDILREIDNFEFNIPDLGEDRFKADALRRPILVLTSNSERDLPDAFLRRCVYHHIEFTTDAAVISRLVAQRLPESLRMNPDFVQSAAQCFVDIRETVRLGKKPATGEFLDWLLVLKMSYPDQLSVKELLAEKSPRGDEARGKTMDTLTKTADDQAALTEAHSRLWKTTPPPTST